MVFLKILKEKECVPLLFLLPSGCLCLEYSCGNWCSKIHTGWRGQRQNRAENYKDLGVEPPYQPRTISWLDLQDRERSICLVYDIDLWDFCCPLLSFIVTNLVSSVGFADVFMTEKATFHTAQQTWSFHYTSSLSSLFPDPILLVFQVH